jgi:hypothetical protein
MSLSDYVRAARGLAPGFGGDGHCRTAGGAPVDLELYKFDT